jgi:hypothetical protein
LAQQTAGICLALCLVHANNVSVVAKFSVELDELLLS